MGLSAPESAVQPCSYPAPHVRVTDVRSSTLDRRPTCGVTMVGEFSLRKCQTANWPGRGAQATRVDQVFKFQLHCVPAKNSGHTKVSAPSNKRRHEL
jgi:hypothetical protein